MLTHKQANFLNHITSMTEMTGKIGRHQAQELHIDHRSSREPIHMNRKTNRENQQKPCSTKDEYLLLHFHFFRGWSRRHTPANFHSRQKAARQASWKLQTQNTVKQVKQSYLYIIVIQKPILNAKIQMIKLNMYVFSIHITITFFFCFLLISR